MQNLLRAAANALANLAEKAHQWADWAEGLGPADSAREFAGVDLVGVDFSTSIQKVASHVIRGWERFRRQADAFGGGRGVWAFGVNAVPFPLTGGPVPPRRLPSFCAEHFERRGYGRGLIEYGSAFYDYFLVALGYAQELGAFDQGRAAVPLTISLLCDSWPNGGAYRAGDVRPLVEAARARGVRFRLVGFALRRHRGALRRFPESLGLTREELEFAWYDEGLPDEQTVESSFDSLASVFRVEAVRAADPRPVRAVRVDRRAACPSFPPEQENAVLTPEEWARCDDPQRMLAFLRDGLGIDRRLRLFACACCWRLGPILDEERRRCPVEAAERFADGLASEGEMKAAAFPVPVAVGWVTDHNAARAAAKAAQAAAGTAVRCSGGSSGWVIRHGEGAVQADLLRCIFGSPPLRPVTVPARVLARGGEAVRRLAEGIYAGRRFEELPVLAGLLQEAGYADAAVLAHLRGPGPHAKGCHALDAVLGKT
jgi:hypothetical protein